MLTSFIGSLFLPFRHPTPLFPLSCYLYYFTFLFLIFAIFIYSALTLLTFPSFFFMVSDDLECTMLILLNRNQYKWFQPLIKPLMCLPAESCFICTKGLSSHSAQDSAMMSQLTLVRRERARVCSETETFPLTHEEPWITPPPLLMALTLCTVLAFVANWAHTVPISAGAVPTAKWVYALRDRDIALGAFPAAVAHTGALVVLAVAAAQHWARRWREEKTKRDYTLCTGEAKKKTKAFRELQSSGKPQRSPTRIHTLTMQEGE